MKTLLSLTLFSIILATSHSVFSSQVAMQTVVKEKDIVKVYQDKKLYLAIKREETGKQICYTGINFLTNAILKYELDSATGQSYGTTQTDGLLCINPASENKFLADMYEKTASRTAATAQSTSSQSSSAATSTQAQSSSTASSLIASVISLFRKS